jgi:nitroreductase
MIKIPNTSYPVIDLIKNRWSNRAFTKDSISQTQLQTLFEAASWAPSCNNEQPWQYFYAQKSNPIKFNALLNCLMTGNSVWAKEADVIIAAVARKTFHTNGNVNDYAMYDVGAANYGMLLQAQSMKIYGHIMAGFHHDIAKQTLNLSRNQQPVAFMALGFLGEAEQLEEPFKTRELTARSRTAVNEIAFEF